MRDGRAQTVGSQVSRMRRKFDAVFGLFLVALILPQVALLNGCAGLVSAGGKQTGTIASFLLNPASISFGQVAVGKQAMQSVSVSNNGTTALNITQVKLSNTQFSMTGMSTPMPLAVGQTASFSVAVNPTAAGNLSATLTATGDSGSNPVVVNLSATAVSSQPQLSVSSTSIDFGSVVSGQKSTSNLVLSNLGTADLTISALAVTGAGFAISGVSTPKTISAGQSAQAVATFSPTATGSASGNINITSNDPANPTMNVPLTGTGTQAGLTISPASFNFGSVVDGQTKSQSFTVTNSGTAPLTIAQLSVTGSGYNVGGLVTPATLAAGGATTFSVLFAPTTAGSLAGTVSVMSNAPNSPTAVPLSGTGTAASVTLTSNPSSLSFPTVNVGSSSSQNVTITNASSSSVTLSQVTLNATDFAVSGISTPMTLTAGQNASMSVSFSPKALENISGNITVTTSQGSSSVISVTGAGVEAGLKITPTSASFGNVTVGSPSTQTIQLTNSGTATLTITQVSASGSGFSTATLSLPISLNPTQSTTFNIQFAPPSAGTDSGSVSIVSNAPGSPATIALSGTGMAATHLLSFSSTSLSFGNVNTGSQSTQSITVTNTGNANVTISQIVESGTGFALNGASIPVTLTPGQNLSFSVNFTPSAVGNDSGTVTVTSNATASPTTITLAGAGVTAAPHSVALNWNASSSTVSGYNVYRSTTRGTGYNKINTALVAALTYSDTTVVNGTTYYYVTTAVDSSGNESTYSNEAAAPIP